MSSSAYVCVCGHESVCVCLYVRRMQRNEKEALVSPYLGHPEGISFHGGISGSPHGHVSLHSR